MDPQGNALAVWSQSNGTGTDIIDSNRFTASDGSWGPTERIDLDGGAQHPQIAVHPRGNAIAVWEQSDTTRLNIWGAQFH